MLPSTGFPRRSVADGISQATSRAIRTVEPLARILRAPVGTPASKAGTLEGARYRQGLCCCSPASLPANLAKLRALESSRCARRTLMDETCVLETFIASRRNRSGVNFHASALARMRAATLLPGQLSEWGRRGAQARLEKRLAARMDGSTTSLAASLPNGVPVSDVPESG